MGATYKWLQVAEHVTSAAIIYTAQFNQGTSYGSIFACLKLKRRMTHLAFNLNNSFK